MTSMSKNVYIIGAGNIGSRHLQALKAVTLPLNIFVIDPSSDSLTTAQSRFESMPEGSVQHRVSYSQSLPEQRDIADVLIVATSSAQRREVLERALAVLDTKYLILEKLLFQNPHDYDEIGQLLQSKNIPTWVNCPMRMMPFYKGIQDSLRDGPFDFRVRATGLGLVTTVIHYLDCMAWLSGSTDFQVDTSQLDTQPIPSKRNGYLELTGILSVVFANGSNGLFTFFPGDVKPHIITIRNQDNHYVIQEVVQKATRAQGQNDWQYVPIEITIPYQSTLTTGLVENLLTAGMCELPSYAESAKIHTTFLEPLRSFLNQHSEMEYAHYPFT